MSTDQIALTRRQVAELLQTSESAVYRLWRARRLPAVRVGRELRFYRAEVDEFLRRESAAAVAK